jgi:hypothetical protein
MLIKKNTKGEGILIVAINSYYYEVYSLEKKNGLSLIQGYFGIFMWCILLITSLFGGIFIFFIILMNNKITKVPLGVKKSIASSRGI